MFETEYPTCIILMPFAPYQCVCVVMGGGGPKNKVCCFGNSVFNAINKQTHHLNFHVISHMVIVITVNNTKQINLVEQNDSCEHKCHVSPKTVQICSLCHAHVYAYCNTHLYKFKD